MDTVRKRNISGEDLEVSTLGYQLVAADDEVDLPKYYPWHTDDDPAEVLYPESLWADVGTPKVDKGVKNSADETPKE